MDKLAPRSHFAIFLGWVGYVVAFVFIFGVSLIVRCGGLSTTWQRLAWASLFIMAVILGTIFLKIRMYRDNHHEYERGRANYMVDIGPTEQKCYQLSLIFAITAFIIWIDMWFAVLPKLANNIFPLLQ